MRGTRGQPGGVTRGFEEVKKAPMDSREQPPAKVRFIRREGYTVAIADQPINEEALREALADLK